jgi:hypothetical protein
MAKTCIVCGAARRQTKEHAVPKWFANLKPENALVRAEGEHRNVQNWDIITNKVELKVGGCCTDCNSGWMSRLEGDSKPVLLPLIAGREVHLTADEQRLISAWAVKTPMVLECSGARSRVKYFSQNERSNLRVHRRLPPSTAVFLAGYRGRHAFRASENPAVFFDDTGRFDGYSSTTAFGSLVVQVFSFRRQSGNRLFRVSGNFDEAEVQIWPCRATVVWPPEEVFADEGFEAYTGRWIVNTNSEA